MIRTHRVRKKVRCATTGAKYERDERKKKTKKIRQTIETNVRKANETNVAGRSEKRAELE